MNALSLLWTKILRFVTIINFPTDILDVAIVAFIIYKLLNLSRSRTVTQVVKAVVVLLVISYISDALGLNTLNYIISKTIEVGLIALVVVFQPELRRLLERLGFRREAHLRGNLYFWRDENGAPLWKDTYVYGKLRTDEANRP